MQIHLFSNPGSPPIADIVRAARPYLRGKTKPVVAYLPAAGVGAQYIDITERAFGRSAQVHTLDPEIATPEEIRATLDTAAVVYIPGGNTYVLAWRLQQAGLLDDIRQRVLAGLPLVAFSAGTVLCGPTILTTNDMNVCACRDFRGLDLVPFNFNVHYPQAEGEDRDLRDERIREYYFFNNNPVLALQDGAHIHAQEGEVELVAGDCWLFEKGQEKRKLEPGIIPNP